MKKKKTTFVSGNFNILHPGHLRLLKFAKSVSGYLIVAVNSNKIAGSAATVDEKLRVENIKSCSYVDKVVLINKSLKDTLKKFNPSIVVKGKEYENQNNPEQEFLSSYGGRLIFSSGEIAFSSYDLIQKEFQKSNLNTISIPKQYLHRHKLNKKKLITLLKKTSKLKIAIIGDLIVDKYISCQPLGMSQEDPTIVVTPVDTKLFIGGAGIVSLHASGLGAKVNFFTVSGNDEYYRFATKELKSKNVNSKIFKDENRPTTLKIRYRSSDKTLLRVSNLQQVSISKTLQKKIYSDLKKIIHKIDLVVFSDFNYGCLPQSLVDKIINLAKEKKIMIVADSQSSSQNGNICRYKNMDLITPTEKEARIATRNYEDGLIVLADKLREESFAKNSLIKLGPEGLLVHTQRKNKKHFHTDKIGALNLAPKDTIGAGDSMLISAAMIMAVGGSIWEAALIGSLASALQVSRVGNSPLNMNELIQEIK